MDGIFTISKHVSTVTLKVSTPNSFLNYSCRFQCKNIYNVYYAAGWLLGERQINISNIFVVKACSDVIQAEYFR